tara:strand:- start:836 stop:5950 length:5115 start_codon:yes stop_codon:yes gene_type:complete
MANCSGIIGSVWGGNGVTGPIYNPVYYPDLTAVSGPSGPVQVFDIITWASTNGITVGQCWEKARYGDKIWMYIKRIEFSPLTQSNVYTHSILELDFDETIPIASFSRLIPLQNQQLCGGDTQYGGYLAGGQGINDSTVVFCRKQTGYGNPLADDIVKFDVSGNTAVETILFSTSPNAGQVSTDYQIQDMIYVPPSDTYVTIGVPYIVGSQTIYSVNHHSATGTLLGTVNLDSSSLSGFPSGTTTWTAGIFCYDGEVIVPVNGFFNNLFSPSIYTLDLTTMTLSFLADIVGSYTFALTNDAATNPECCGEILDPEPSEFCYEIGDITNPNDPFSGGAGGMVFATPFTGANQTPYYYEVALNDISVGNHPLEHNVNHTVDPSIQAELNCGITPSSSPQHSFNCPWDNPIDTNIPNNMCRWGYGTGSFQPSATPPGINILTGVSVGDPVQALGQSQNQLYPPGTVIDDIVQVPASSVNTIIVVGGVAVNLTALSYDSYLFLFNNSTIPTVPSFSQPIKILTTGGTSTTAGPFSTTGAEWGGYGESLLSFLPTDFGEGKTNTQQIVAHPASPVWGTHDVAAELCGSYTPAGTGTNRWFLPSLDEFDIMFNNVGPNTSYGAMLNLNGQLNDMSDTYWTSSSKNALPTDYSAWAYNTSVPPYSLTPVPPNPTGPVAAQRCSVLSVRPIRRFECIQEEILEPCDTTCNGFLICGGQITTTTFSSLWWYSSIADYTTGGGIEIITQQQMVDAINNSGQLPSGMLSVNNTSEISMFDNKVWMRTIHGNLVDQNLAEFIVDWNTTIPTVYFSRFVVCDSQWGINGGSGVDNYNFRATRRSSVIDPVTFTYPEEIINIDVSGNTAVVSQIFEIPGSNWNTVISRDTLYLCGSDTYVTSGRLPNDNFDSVSHWDASGNLLGSVPIDNNGNGKAYGVCCFNGEILVSRMAGNANNTLHSVNLTNYTISLEGSGEIVGDMASNPTCCPGCCGTEEPIEDPCDYQVGDVGPAGGVIVAVPYMNVNTNGNPITEIVGPNVPPIQGDVYVKNFTNYYYELSPENLNNTDCASNSDMVSLWGFVSDDSGAWMSCDIANDPVVANAWVPDATLYDIPTSFGGGSFVTGPVLSTGEIMEYVGQGQVVNDAYKLANYPGTPWHDPTFGGVWPHYACGWPNVADNKGAFKLCWDYNLNGFSDWFLPTVGEMDFARNYTNPGTLYNSADGFTNGWPAHSNETSTDDDMTPDYFGGKHYWTCNTYKQDGSENVVEENDFWLSNVPPGHGAIYVDNDAHLWSYNNTTDITSLPNWYAYSVSMDPMTYSNPAATPDDQGWKTANGRLDNLNVRAMRRFECGAYEPPPPNPSPVVYNYREGKVASGYPTFSSLNTGLFEIYSYDSVNNVLSRGLGPQHCGYHPTDGYAYGVTLKISKGDIVGNIYKEWDFGWEGNGLGGSGWNPDVPAGSSIFISVWDLDENFIGKWEYFLSPSQTICNHGEGCYVKLNIGAHYDQSNPLSQQCNHIAGPYLNFNFADPAHVPVTYPSGQQAGRSLYYIRLEMPASSAVSSNIMANTQELHDYGLNVTGNPYSMRFPTGGGGQWAVEFEKREYQCDCSGLMTLNSNGNGGNCWNGSQPVYCAPWLHTFACDSLAVSNNFSNVATVSPDCNLPPLTQPNRVDQICESSLKPFKPEETKAIEKQKEREIKEKEKKEEEKIKLKNTKENDKRTY